MINSLAPTIGNMEEPVNEWVVKNQLDGNEDLWEDEEWGFYEDLSFKDDFEDESDTFDEDMTQTNFKSIDVAFEDISKLALSEADVFFDDEILLFLLMVHRDNKNMCVCVLFVGILYLYIQYGKTLNSS